MTSSTNDWPTISGNPPRRHYGISPWTILDQSSGPWQKRKKYLIGQGIDDLAGRPQGLLFEGDTAAGISGGTSRFDPVLADLMYEWYAPHGGNVYDPFAGGITRGAMAHHHDMDYVGVDLSEKQVAANRAQADQLGVTRAQWIVGDGTEKHIEDGWADMILTCPPYHTLERYSDHPRDLSAMPWDKHLDALRAAAAHCHSSLHDGRFLVWVTGDLRDRHGHLRGLPHHTRQILIDTGLRPINDHILITPVGTLYRNLRPAWTRTRTATRRHQHVIVMVKGDRREATEVINAGIRERGWTQQIPQVSECAPNPRESSTQIGAQ